MGCGGRSTAPGGRDARGDRDAHPRRAGDGHADLAVGCECAVERTHPRRAYDLLADEFGPGANAEVLIVAESTGPDKADPGAVDLALDRISRQPGVVAVSPLMPSPTRRSGSRT